MKKILMALMLCLVSICVFGQSYDFLNYDYIKYVVTFPDTTTKHAMITEYHGDDGAWYTREYIDTIIKDKVHFDYNKVAYNLNYDKQKFLHKYIYTPTQSVLNNYKIGYKCFTAGKCIIGVGIPITLVGVICTGVGVSEMNSYRYRNGISDEGYNTYKAGVTLLGIGGTMLSVSIPLLCWGDHIKRECNMIIGK